MEERTESAHTHSGRRAQPSEAENQPTNANATHSAGEPQETHNREAVAHVAQGHIDSMSAPQETQLEGSTNAAQETQVYKGLTNVAQETEPSQPQPQPQPQAQPQPQPVQDSTNPSKKDSDYDRARKARRARPPREVVESSSKNDKDKKKDDKKNGEETKTRKKKWGLAGILTAFVIGLITWNFVSSMQWTQIRTSEGMDLLRGSSIERVEVTNGINRVQLWLTKPTTTTLDNGTKKDTGKQVEFQFVDAQGKDVMTRVQNADIKKGYNSVVPTQSLLMSLVTSMLPILIILGFFYWAMRMQMGNRFGAKDQSAQEEKPNVTFADVAGEDEAVEEVREIVDFLKNPDRYAALGARIPRGVLLYGPPGTGKTLLAKAVAGEADVPFFSISASEFIEMFVGVGASRVRDLFKQAKKKAPAIIFIDEIDAIGRGRSQGPYGNDERDQTLNQLLVEMDGFETDEAVVLMAATNRPDVLDDALLRPGRFDRQVSVDAPDIKGREAILRVHAEGKPLGPDVDLAGVAKRTPGFTGADLANILNEAALLAARHGNSVISNDDLDEASDRVMAGPQRKSRVMSPEDRRMTAYHEGGHALAAAALHHSDPVTKVTILPRGRALGYTMVMPTEDRYSVTRNQLLDQLTYALGGRAAEEIVFGDPSTGASNDIQKATATARKMVTEYGMSEHVGAVRLVADEGKEHMMGGSQHSDSLTATVDENVRKLLDDALTEAWWIITNNRDVLDRLAQRLLEKETVLEDEIAEIFADVVKTPQRELWLSAPNRPISSRPPIPLMDAEGNEGTDPNGSGRAQAERNSGTGTERNTGVTRTETGE
ncbi:ATP-dependent zinc metalloprotease FtsH [Actinotignum urinale]|uniref:ATP-dependent zinc metalloprotease FtsH n=2 Tax=Actinotignum urinale TaxID=190146 RepID=A0AAW9HZC0_9ACTO|nr:ATP-dependent zinc metalloprotease FtsH [Actinotignum urinale]MDY5155201.1 ATP-dependent zinc metalloprotease FtsH [Actinotignum urinale]